MPLRRRILFALLAMICISISDRLLLADDDKPANPLKALLITGGSSHDYPSQQQILSEGISRRANVEWKIVLQGETRDTMIEFYKNPNWADGYDVVVHNECFGGVQDDAFIEQIAKPHFDGVPAVTIHCSTHSYRNAKTDEWRKLLGVSSFGHETHYPLAVKPVQHEHPIMKGFPETWNTPNGELYIIEKQWPNCVPLAQAYGKRTEKNHTCVWVNTYGKGRLFGTTIGHHNITMRQEVYLDMVARGLLWACKKLDDDGKPLPGYEAAKSATAIPANSQ
ncbi:MAG: ThuA domain-containing protein [Pirellulales bacterium]|nr:ThuA domain-containing protein [Pirellulales bacterium]